MKLDNLVSALTLGVGVGAFGLTGALSMRAGVEPLYAVIRGIAAFMLVVWIARWSANTLNLTSDEPDAPLGSRDAERQRSDRV